MKIFYWGIDKDGYRDEYSLSCDSSNDLFAKVEMLKCVDLHIKRFE